MTRSRGSAGLGASAAGAGTSSSTGGSAGGRVTGSSAARAPSTTTTSAFKRRLLSLAASATGARASVPEVDHQQRVVARGRDEVVGLPRVTIVEDEVRERERVPLEA